MANIPDFSVHTDPAILQAFQNAQAQKQKAQQQQLENNNQTFQQTLDTINAVSGAVGHIVQGAAKQQQENLINSATKLLAQPEPSQTFTQMAPGGDVPGPEAPQQAIPNPDYGAQMAQRKQAASRLAVAIAPKETGEAMAKQLYSEPKTPTAAPSFQSKQVTVDGVPKEVLFDPSPTSKNPYLDPLTKQPITGQIAPYGQASATAEQRALSRVDKQAESMGKDLNDLAINSNSPAGISAKRALYAKSGLNLIQQTENQPGGTDKRQMAELQMEVARVLTGQGVMTNETLNSLATQTANSKVKNWEEWLTNNPTGLEQQKFVDRFKTTLQRQADFHGKELDKYKQKTMAKYTAFENQAPKDFQDSLRQAGYDPVQYKKTRKLVPLGADVNPVEFDSLLNTPNSEANSGSRPPLDSFFK